MVYNSSISASRTDWSRIWSQKSVGESNNIQNPGSIGSRNLVDRDIWSGVADTSDAWSRLSNYISDNTRSKYQEASASTHSLPIVSETQHAVSRKSRKSFFSISLMNKTSISNVSNPKPYDGKLVGSDGTYSKFKEPLQSSDSKRRKSFDIDDLSLNNCLENERHRTSTVPGFNIKNVSTFPDITSEDNRQTTKVNNNTDLMKQNKIYNTRPSFNAIGEHKSQKNTYVRTNTTKTTSASNTTATGTIGQGFENRTNLSTSKYQFGNQIVGKSGGEPLQSSPVYANYSTLYPLASSEGLTRSRLYDYQYPYPYAPNISSDPASFPMSSAYQNNFFMAAPAPYIVGERITVPRNNFEISDSQISSNLPFERKLSKSDQLDWSSKNWNSLRRNKQENTRPYGSAFAFEQKVANKNLRTNNECIFAGQKSSLLESLRTNRPIRLEIKEVAGNIADLAKDQYGSRYLQQKVELGSREDSDSIYNEIFPNCLQLMTDVFGNYVVQKILEYGSQNQKIQLAKKMQNQFQVLSLQMYGCRVVQKALEHLPLEQQLSIVYELKGCILRCIKDQNGNHVIQRIIEKVPSSEIEFITDAIHSQAYNLAIHPYGCRVVQRVFEHIPAAQEILLKDLFKHLRSLIQDQYGNYVVQHVLEHGGFNKDDKSKIVDIIKENISFFAKHKFASNVVEKCLIYAQADEVENIINEALRENETGSVLYTLMKDQFGNYVVQKMLETSKGSQKQRLIAEIKPLLTNLKLLSQGKHIVSIEKALLANENL